MRKTLERVAWALFGAIVASAFVGVAQSAGATDTLYRKLEVLAEVFGHIENHYVDTVSPTELVYNAARGAVTGLDPNSDFFDPDEYSEILNTTEGEYAGVGVELAMRDEFAEVVAVFDRSPAHAAPGPLVSGS